METFSALLALCEGNSPVPGEFPAQRPVTRSFDVFFDPRPNKRWSKQSWGWWLETPSRSLWRHCNDYCLSASEVTPPKYKSVWVLYLAKTCIYFGFRLISSAYLLILYIYIYMHGVDDCVYCLFRNTTLIMKYRLLFKQYIGCWLSIPFTRRHGLLSWGCKIWLIVYTQIYI